jgi:hypothetical protein
MAGYIGSKASVVSSGAERKKIFTITGATTSLTGLNYTVGKVHVFQNGVRLVDGTDYTATNGTTITLTVAAQSGDNVVAISQAGFQVADIPDGTPSIDDNGTGIVLTIDSSDHFMVGTTAQEPSVSNDDSGFSVRPVGTASISRTGGPTIDLNRKASDGLIAVFRKDGTTVGSIGTSFGDITIGGKSGLRFDTDSSQYVIPYNVTDNAHTTTVDLGTTDRRFKDAYLSGGVYLGGTTSANKLDDYEEGTWTPVGVNVNIGSTYHASYIKVGKMVTIQCWVNMANGTGNSSNGRISGLPFTSVTYSVGSTNISANNSSISRLHIRSPSNNSFVQFMKNNDTEVAGQDMDAGHVQFTLTYTAS